jgi:hypothetical protein
MPTSSSTSGALKRRRFFNRKRLLFAGDGAARLLLGSSYATFSSWQPEAALLAQALEDDIQRRSC